VRYLLDTTFLIDHANNDAAAIQLMGRLFEDGHELFTCDVVTCEALSRALPADRRHLRVLLDALEYVSTSPDAARRAADIRAERHLAGGKRALGDALIAGVAADLDAIVVTRNERDFERAGVTLQLY
jgi:predicted nucleic acid-binding protein